MIRGKISLKALYSFKCLVMYFKISLNKEFDLEKSGKINKKSGNFSQLQQWQPWTKH